MVSARFFYLLQLYAILFVMPIYHNNPTNVIYVPGYLSGTDTQEEALAMLAKIYPQATITVFPWESTGSWLQARHCCNSAATKLFLYTTQFNSASTILVGHSLGARIVIQTLALAAKNNTRFLQAVCIGAAIWYKDARIKKAAKAVIYPLVNIYQPEDLVLKYIYPLTEHSLALGCVGISAPIDNVEQICITEKPKLWKSVIHWLLRKATWFDRWLYSLGHAAETVYLQALYDDMKF